MKRFLALSLLFAPVLASAHDYKIGDLVIDHPVSFATPVTAMAGAGYMVITNTGDTIDRLVNVTADFPRVMMHDTKVEDDVASMIHLDGIDIPPGETITFQPGGLHVMFMGLDGDPFETGETVSATLVFEQAGEIEVVFNVEDRPAADADVDHSGH